jgi:hypothetical protein
MGAVGVGALCFDGPTPVVEWNGSWVEGHLEEQHGK